MSQSLSYVETSKNIYDFLVGKTIESDSGYENENPPCHSSDRWNKDLKQVCNSVSAFLLSLGMSCAGYSFNMLLMSWYNNIKPFRTNVKLFIFICVFVIKYFFPGDDSFCNYVILVVISKYFLCCCCEIKASETIMIYFLKHGVN